jgi:hypothetical protein
MHASVTAVFDVSRILQSWKWSVEAYATACIDNSLVKAGIQKEHADSFQPCFLSTVQFVEALHPLFFFLLFLELVNPVPTVVQNALSDFHCYI